MSFWFPFGADSAMQGFFSRPEADKFANECTVLHVLNMSVDAVAWKVYLRAICSYWPACRRGRLGRSRFVKRVYGFFLLHLRCVSRGLGINSRGRLPCGKRGLLRSDRGRLRCGRRRYLCRSRSDRGVNTCGGGRIGPLCGGSI